MRMSIKVAFVWRQEERLTEDAIKVQAEIVPGGPLKPVDLWMGREVAALTPDRDNHTVLVSGFIANRKRAAEDIRRVRRRIK